MGKLLKSLGLTSAFLSIFGLGMVAGSYNEKRIPTPYFTFNSRGQDEKVHQLRFIPVNVYSNLLGKEIEIPPFLNNYHETYVFFCKRPNLCNELARYIGRDGKEFVTEKYKTLFPDFTKTINGKLLNREQHKVLERKIFELFSMDLEPIENYQVIPIKEDEVS